jgi:hypothetical protein
VYKEQKLGHLECDISYTISMSAGILTWHLRVKHRHEYEEYLEHEMTKKLRNDTDSGIKVQSSLHSFIKYALSFEKILDYTDLPAIDSFQASLLQRNAALVT